MANDYIFGKNIFKPLITDLVALHANMQGKMFCALTGDVSLNNGESLVVVLTNGSNTNTIGISHHMMTTAHVDMDVDFIRNPVFSGGTPTSLMVCSMNSDYSDDSAKITASKIQGTLTLTSGTIICSRLIPKGGEGIYYSDGKLILTPGNSLSFQCLAKAIGSVNIDISWYELPSS